MFQLYNLSFTPQYKPTAQLLLIAFFGLILPIFFQEKLSDLANLTHLEITSSAITSIPDSISKLPSLTHLYLSDNPLDQLPATSLTHLDNLKKVGHFLTFERGSSQLQFEN